MQEININTLNDSEQWFHEWINSKMPYLLNLFDWQRAEFIADAVENYLATASTAQCCMCRFALMVWCHENRYEFDPAHIHSLGQTELNIISDWFRNPIWP